jgi:hypothetical protein
MPTQSFETYGNTWSYCGRCGKPKNIVGGGYEICTCPPEQHIFIRDDETQKNTWIDWIRPGSVYAGKVAGIPVYVNSKEDAETLSFILEEVLNLGYSIKDE